jgi:hypothetical protein
MGHGTSVTIHFPQARAETLLPSEAFDIPATQ